jgi:hypothetical protein
MLEQNGKNCCERGMNKGVTGINPNDSEIIFKGRSDDLF